MAVFDWFLVLFICFCAYLGYKSFKKHRFGAMNPKNKEGQARVIMTTGGDFGIAVETQVEGEGESLAAHEEYQQWEKDTFGDQSPPKRLGERIDDEHLPLLQEYMDKVSGGKIKLEYTKRKQYIAVHLVGKPRSWICRLNDAYGTIFIEPNGFDKIRMYHKPKLTKKIQARLDKAVEPYLDE